MRNKKYDTPIRIVCAVLFVIFSFLYICMMQGELLALVQDHLAQGKTSNNTIVTATLITSLLFALQYLLNKLGRLHGKFEALSYLPSCALLALMTKVDGGLSYSFVQWLVCLCVVAAVYGIFVWFDRNTVQFNTKTLFSQLSTNLFFLALLFVFTGWYGNSSPVRQMELAAWRHTHDREYAKVLKVGERSDECNAGFTALRNLALAQTGQLGSRMFAYPQHYGSDGLMMNRYNVQTPTYGASEFYDILGAQPYGGEAASAFYKRMSEKTDSVIYRDLYVAALLLDKNLEDFVQTVGGERAIEAILPVHHQEALIIYNEQHPFTPVVFATDNEVEQRYQEYLTLRETHADNLTSMQNLSKRMFGDTYWYYYDFVK